MRRFALILGLVLGLCGTASAHWCMRWGCGTLRLPMQQTTTLIAPSGQPVGGRWQRWMNESQAPTYPGIVILATNTAKTHSVCGTDGCSAPAGPCDYSTCGLGHPETWLTSDDTRDGLYYEHGHIIDFTVATDVDRATFMRIWRVPGTVAAWWRGEDVFATQDTHPAGELWSAAYELCADGSGDLDSINAAQGRSLGRWAIDAQQKSCRLFRSL